MTFQVMASKSWSGVLVLLLASAGTACAQTCAQSQPSGLAVVAGGGRAYFHGDAELCPGRRAYCLKRAYVIAADRVLTSLSRDEYTCVFAPRKTATTSGWIETKRLRREVLKSRQPPSDWEGDWESEGDMEIKIGRDKSGLQASGVDDWNSGDGYGDDGKIVLHGRNHHAEFSGRLMARENHARLKDGACGVDLTLMDEFMIVEDDTSCGDGNASFSGIYHRNP